MAMPVIEVRLDPPLLHALRAQADVEGVGLNELIRRLLAEGLKREREAHGVGVGPLPPAGGHVEGDTFSLFEGARDGDEDPASP